MMTELRPYLQFWRTVTTVLAPLLLCPLVFVINTPEAKENINFTCQSNYQNQHFSEFSGFLPLNI